VLDSDLNPIPTTDVMVILRPVPVDPIHGHELLPPLKVSVKLRACEAVNAVVGLAPSVNSFTNATQIIFRKSELKS